MAVEARARVPRAHGPVVADAGERERDRREAEAERQRDRDLKARLESLRERDEVDKGPDGNYAELSDDTKAQLKHVQQLLANKHQR